MAKRKRKHQEFAQDVFGLSEATHGNMEHEQKSNLKKTTKTNSTDDSAATTPEDSTNVDKPADGQWEVTFGKKARKAKRKQEKAAQKALEAELLGPSLFFHNKVVSPLRVRDLQGLILYVLSDGVAPVWVALRNGKQIDQIVVVHVPGMEKQVLSALASSISSEDDFDQSQTTLDLTVKPLVSADTSERTSEDVNVDRPPLEDLPSSPPADCIFPIKAPGDAKAGKIHSSLQAMLISPEEKGKGSYKGADNVFAPAPTPLPHFVHTADELVEAQYPVHPALFTSSVDAELERSRREVAGQSSASGWKDTFIVTSRPTPPETKVEPGDLSGGVQVYALDCEMVVTTDDVYSLARISVLNWFGKVVLDKLVKPGLPVKDYCTAYSGITEKKLEGVETRLEDIQKELWGLFTPSTVVIGHSLESDFNAMKMTHPFVADTSMLYPHPRGLPLRSSLKFLANKYLKREIQRGGANGHDSVEDARAVLDLVRLKCEKGPKWGTMDANGESIFARLNGSRCRTAIVEYGTPEKGLGRLASLHVVCQNDDEITASIINLAEKQDVKEKVNFVWGRLRDLETMQDCNDGGASKPVATSHTNGNSTPADFNGSEELEPKQTGANRQFEALVSQKHEVKLKLSQSKPAMVDRLSRIYNALAPSTIFMVFSGPGDMREVKRLQDMQRQYQKEFKVKKWDELRVKWTDDEVQALKKATEQARKGWAMVTLK